MAQEPIRFEIAGVAYKARRPDIFVQFAIARKIAPLIATGAAQLVRIVKAAQEGGVKLKDLPPETMIEQFAPLVGRLAELPEDDVRFIIEQCLRVTERNIGNARMEQWAPVWPAGLPEPAFPEFRDDMVATMSVIVSVIGGLLGNFMPGGR